MAFAPPTFWSAKLTAGSVERSSSGTQESLPVGATGREWEATVIRENTEEVPMPSLVRTETMSRRILEIQKPSSETSNGDSPNSTIAAFWLQRKVGQLLSSHDVAARLGYRLRPRKGRKRAHNETTPVIETNHEDAQPALSAWELDTDEKGEPILAKVHIVHNVRDSEHHGMLLNELGALHKIAQHTKSSGHVVGSNLIAQDPKTQTIYAILPHHSDGTLLQFCQSSGNLPEPLARFLFRQILEGLTTLKSAGMCHRNLSLDTIEMNGDRIDIVGLGWALQCDDAIATNQIKKPDDGMSSSLTPTPGGSDPRFIPPESFLALNSSQESTIMGSSNYACREWNGFRDDLWAAGLILYSMVVGTDALFASPIAGDQRFKKLCILGDMKGEAQRFGITLSDDLIKLLQSMMSADPQRRPTLEQVMENAWVTRDDVSVTPTSFSADLNPDPFER